MTYHLKSDGLPGICKAQPGNCPRGDQEEHYTTKLEAIVAAEKKLMEENQEYLDAAKKERTLYHLDVDGIVEECPFRPGYCTIRPLGLANNKHTTDEKEAESFSRSFREIQGSSTGPASTPKPRQAPKKTGNFTSQAKEVRESSFDRMKKDQGWTDEEIRRYHDSCGHFTPSRFSRPISSGGC